MRKLWMVLGVTLVLSLVWCTVPAFGGWSWDPIFKINGQTVKMDIELRLDEPLKDGEHVHVLLRIPTGADGRVLQDGGLNVQPVQSVGSHTALWVWVDHEVDGFHGMTVTLTSKGQILAEEDTTGRTLRLGFELQ